MYQNPMSYQHSFTAQFKRNICYITIIYSDNLLVHYWDIQLWFEAVSTTNLLPNNIQDSNLGVSFNCITVKNTVCFFRNGKCFSKYWWLLIFTVTKRFDYFVKFRVPYISYSSHRISMLWNYYKSNVFDDCFKMLLPSPKPWEFGGWKTSCFGKMRETAVSQTLDIPNHMSDRFIVLYNQHHLYVINICRSETNCLRIKRKDSHILRVSSIFNLKSEKSWKSQISPDKTDIGYIWH